MFNAAFIERRMAEHTLWENKLLRSFGSSRPAKLTDKQAEVIKMALEQWIGVIEELRMDPRELSGLKRDLELLPIAEKLLRTL